MTGGTTPMAPPFDLVAIRAEFPILGRKVHGKRLVYLDSAATAQKPRAVLDAQRRYYEELNANVHRGVHWLSQEATRVYEEARERIQRHLNAAAREEIVFVRGATEAINLVAQTLGRTRVSSGDEILLSGLEHHSNIVPWQLLAEEKGARIRVIPLDARGALCQEEFHRLLGPKTRILAFSHVSNALGTVNPVKEMVAAARAAGVVTVVDGAQAVPHLPVDVRDLGCDFYAFSGHKVFGPTGIGALYGRRSLLESMPPWQGGGDMIASVTFEKSTWNSLPWKFEAGTPHIEGAVGLAAALDYLAGVGLERIAAWEHELVRYGTGLLENLPGVRILGTAPGKAAVLSFVIEGVHPHDAGTILDREGIAVRAGHHCAQPVMDFFGVPATCRASLAFYNTPEELDTLALGIRKVQEIFGE